MLSSTSILGEVQRYGQFQKRSEKSKGGSSLGVTGEKNKQTPKTSFNLTGPQLSVYLVDNPLEPISGARGGEHMDEFEPELHSPPPLGRGDIHLLESTRCT